MNGTGKKAAWLAGGAGLALLAGAAVASETATFRYDPVGRLIRVERSGSVNNGLNTNYVLDRADNRSQRTTGTAIAPPPAPMPPAPPAFAVADANTTEGGALTFVVTRTGSAAGSYTLDYATADLNAKAGSDYYGTSGTLTFAANQSAQSVTVYTMDDAVYETVETLYLSLSNPSGGAAISDGQSAGTIVDNDPAPPPPAGSPPVTASDSASVKVCQAVTVNVIANDSDPDGNYPLTLVSVTGGTRGSASVSSSSSVLYEAGDVPGTDTLTYTVQDSSGASATGTLSVTVLSGNTCL